jgi:hypothetical protein
MKPVSVVLIFAGLIVSQLTGCGGSVASLSDQQLQSQLEEAEADWKVKGAGVAESDAPYIGDPKIQASYKRVKELRTEKAARDHASH